MIDGDASGCAGIFGSQPQVLTKLEGVCAVQASGTVVPALQRALAEGRLGDTDTLALSTANTPDIVVADPGVYRVPETEHCHHNIPHVLRVLLPRDPWQAVSRGSGQGGERERISNGQLGEMNIGLRTIDGFTAELGMHLLGRDACRRQLGSDHSTG